MSEHCFVWQVQRHIESFSHNIIFVYSAERREDLFFNLDAESIKIDIIMWDTWEYKLKRNITFSTICFCTGGWMLLVQDETSYSQMKKKSKTTVAAVGKHTSDIICT